MSQPNGNCPSFHLNVQQPQLFDAHGTQGDDAAFHRWTHQAFQAMEEHASSPSLSVRTPLTAPSPGSYHHVSINPPSARLQNHQDHSGIAMLAVPDLHGQSNSASCIATNIESVDFPLHSGIYDDPWSSERRRNSSASPTDHRTVTQPSFKYDIYEESPRFIASVVPRSDSGYDTQPTRSAMSNDLDRVDREAQADFSPQFGNTNFNFAASRFTEIAQAQSDCASQYSRRSANGSRVPLRCGVCSETLKCPSDQKKHTLKHNKPFECDVPGCQRVLEGRGFTTKNDLFRHKKSVHRIDAEKGSYQCASENCRHKFKIWTRLDNFKQHLSRMHKDEDEQDLVSRSAYPGRRSAKVVSVAPRDTPLMNMNAHGQLLGTGADDSVAATGASLPPYQECDKRTEDDANSQRLASDNDQSSTFASCLISYITGDDSPTVPHPSSQITASSLPTASITQPPRDRLENCENTLIDKSNSRPPRAPGFPKLSFAPQTKVDQQRQASRKVSKAVSNEVRSAPLAESADLECFVLRILHNVANLSRRDTGPYAASDTATNSRTAAARHDFEVDFAGKEIQEAKQAIITLIRQNGSFQGISGSHRSPKASTSRKLRCRYTDCTTTLDRDCDMKKHLKRHTKPYGCTYPKCHKRFGAKSDWKRHENSQHFQLECFRCQHSMPPSSHKTTMPVPTPCGELFFRVDLFKSHLETKHTLPADAIVIQVKACRIGRNGQTQFWCGFCQKIIRLKSRRNAAWDERFEHIDDHYSRKKERIDDWLCLEENMPKGKTQNRWDKFDFEAESGEDEDEFYASRTAAFGEEVNSSGNHDYSNGRSYAESRPNLWSEPQLSPLVAGNKRGLNAENASDTDYASSAPPKRRRK